MAREQRAPVARELQELDPEDVEGPSSSGTLAGVGALHELPEDLLEPLLAGDRTQLVEAAPGEHTPVVDDADPIAESLRLAEDVRAEQDAGPPPRGASR